MRAGCQHHDRVRPGWREPWPERLSEWGLFKGNGSTLEPNPGVLPYDVATPLFSDYAEKHRTVWMPPGAPARYDGEGVFALPVGTILSKTFMYPRGGGGSRRLIETRLLVRSERGWKQPECGSWQSGWTVRWSGCIARPARRDSVRR